MMILFFTTEQWEVQLHVTLCCDGKPNIQNSAKLFGPTILYSYYISKSKSSTLGTDDLNVRFIDIKSDFNFIF